MAPLLVGHNRASGGELVACTVCGSPTLEPDSGAAPICAFCRLRDRVADHEPVPVELVLNGKARKAYLAARATAAAGASNEGDWQ